MNEIVIDTHPLFWYFTQDSTRLPSKTKAYLEGVSRIFVPTIVLLELLYLLQKKRLTNKFSFVLRTLKTSKKYVPLSLDLDIVEQIFRFSTKLESHDSVIVATAQMLRVPLVTKDRKIRDMYKNTIW